MHQPLWADELFSLAMTTGHSLEHSPSQAQGALGDYVEAPEPLPARDYRRYLEHERPPAGPSRIVRAILLSDTSPPFYYLLLSGWTRAVGTGDLALHLFSVACALACMPLMWLVAGRIGGRSAALVACILFAVSPQCLHYSNEGRMYSLTWLLGLGVAWLSLNIHQYGHRTSLLVPWILSSATGLLTHYFFAFGLAAFGMWLLLYPGRCRRAAVVGSALAVILVVAPWYVNLPQSLSSWRITQDWLYLNAGRRSLAALTLPWRLIGSSRDSAVYPIPDVFVLAIVALSALGLYLKRSGNVLTLEGGLIGLWLLAACAGPYVFDRALGTYTTLKPRYAMPALPAGLLLVALGLGRLPSRSRLVFVVLLIAAWSPAIWPELTGAARSREPYSDIGSTLDQMAGKSDVVIVHSIPSGIAGVARYVRESTPIFSWVSQLKERRVPGDLEMLASRYRRILLVRVHAVGQDDEEERWLRKNARLVVTRQLASARIMVFAPVGPGR